MAVQLIESVRKALGDDGRITSKTIEVSAHAGVVTLHGVVDSLAELGIAQEVVETVPGVEEVSNHLQIDSQVDKGPCCPQM